MSRVPGTVVLPSDARHLLTEFRQLGDWCASAASEELRVLLEARRVRVALSIAHALVDSADAPSTAPDAAEPGDAAPAPAQAGPAQDATLPDVSAERATPLRAPPLPRFPIPARAEPPHAPPLAPLRAPAVEPSVRSRPRSAPVTLAPPAEWPRIAAALVGALWPADAADPIDAALRAIEGSDEWCALPAEGQRCLAGCAAARLHVLEEGAPADPRISSAFSMLSAFMKRARPGYVNGLARTHRPELGAWHKDAEAARAALLANARGAAPRAAPTDAELARVRSLCLDAQIAPADLRDAVMASLRRDVRAMLARGVDPDDGGLRALIGALVDELDLPELRATD